ncbi:phosphonate C-P lyase system protein PhnH [Xinfangfangia pollutisoli]|uniref:phosphonate C-P lyase system protein PhnH n=1 Tax=Xinfangfangia pollutisoli TaxID=2865960 RepID=UPI001CD2A668|nr:phosphonate C-P lyase system protein PhnH [Xinfangfangia pollutisoli]
MRPESLTGGFVTPPQDSARAFRTALSVLSRPGTILTLERLAPPAPLSPAAGTLALVLLDSTTPVFLAPSHDLPAVRDWLAFQTGAPLVGPEAAAFAFGNWDALQPLSRFAIGTAEYPDRAATLIAELPRLAPEGSRLTGPGIRDTARLSLPESPSFAENNDLFPLGYDIFFTCGNQVAGLPRSTRVELV